MTDGKDDVQLLGCSQVVELTCGLGSLGLGLDEVADIRHTAWLWKKLFLDLNGVV